MAYRIFNDTTGELVEIRQRKNKKRKGRNFFMVEQLDADNLSKMKDMHGTDHRILWFILSKIDFENKTLMTQAYIAKCLDMQQSLVSQSIKKLVDFGYIRKINVNGTNGYLVNSEFAIKGSEKETKENIDEAAPLPQ